MEQEMRDALLALANIYAKAIGGGLSNAGHHAASDRSFFLRLLEPGTGFTARKYDEVVSWFADNWPDRTAWPRGVKRPSPPIQPDSLRARRKERSAAR